MIKYFDTTLVRKLTSRQGSPDKIQFESWVNIDENGKINKVTITKSSGFKDIDNLFIEAVKQMPKWLPATNDIGNNCKDKQFLPLNIDMFAEFDNL